MIGILNLILVRPPAPRSATVRGTVLLPTGRVFECEHGPTMPPYRPDKRRQSDPPEPPFTAAGGDGGQPGGVAAAVASALSTAAAMSTGVLGGGNAYSTVGIGGPGGTGGLTITPLATGAGPDTASPPVPRQAILPWSLWFLGMVVIAYANPALWATCIKFIVRAQPEVAAVGCGLAVVCGLGVVRLRAFVRDTRPDHFEVLHALDFFAAATVLWTWVNNGLMMVFEPRAPLRDVLFRMAPEALPSDAVVYLANDVMLVGAAAAAVFLTLSRRDSWERAQVHTRVQTLCLSV